MQSKVLNVAYNYKSELHTKYLFYALRKWGLQIFFNGFVVLMRGVFF